MSYSYFNNFFLFHLFFSPFDICILYILYVPILSSSIIPFIFSLRISFSFCLCVVGYFLWLNIQSPHFIFSSDHSLFQIIYWIFKNQVSGFLSSSVIFLKLLISFLLKLLSLPVYYLCGPPALFPFFSPLYLLKWLVFFPLCLSQRVWYF